MVPSPGSAGAVVPGHGRRERSRTGLNQGVHAAKACWGDLRQLVGCRRFRHAHRVKACLELNPALRAGRGPCGVEHQGHRGVRLLVHHPDQGRPELRDPGRPGGRSTAGGRTRARPTAGRPDPGSRIHHLKELRPGSAGRSEIRVLFAFDPTRSALLLLGGDKAGNWQRWYRANIPLAEQLYLDHTTEEEE